MKLKYITMFFIIFILGTAGCATKEEKTIYETDNNEIKVSDSIEEITSLDKYIEINKIQNDNIDELSDDKEELLSVDVFEEKYVTTTLNIRSGPGTENEVIGVLNTNDKVNASEYENGWSKIKIEDGFGYVSSKYLNDDPVEIKHTEEEAKNDVPENNETNESGNKVVSSQNVVSSGMEADILNLLNAYRQENGLSTLVIDAKLNQIAQVRASEASINWSHTRPDGRDFSTAYAEAGVYGIASENLAYGCTSAQEFMDGWKNSPSHNAAMLGGFTKVGIACFTDSYGRIYVAQEFSQ